MSSMSFSRPRQLLHRLLCLLLAAGLAQPALGVAQPMTSNAAPEAAASANRADELDPPCPMHAANRSEPAAATELPSAERHADCCTQMPDADHRCGEDCDGCAAGCGALRLPAGLEVAALSASPPPGQTHTLKALETPRADAPQSKLLRPPALG
jgi:hypothetical protein